MKISDVFKLVPGPIKIEKVRCQTTGAAIEAPFETSVLFQLNEDQIAIVESMVMHGGNLKKVAEDAGMSYPTLRNRLDEIIGIIKGESAAMNKKRQEILDRIEKGDVTPDEGAQLLESL